MSFIKKYKFSLAWMALILFLTLSPGSSLPSVSIIGIDKMVHLFLFFVLTVLITLEIKKANPGLKVRKIIPIGISLILGIMIECIQLYIPDRTFSLLDIAANTSGIAVGVATLMVFFRTKFN